MAATDKRRSASSESEERRVEPLDPRICVELEKLNKSSENINRWELELDEARLLFRRMLSESTQQLNDLAKKLGSCIDKSRSYYDARVRLAEAQRIVQNAALRFERACSQQTAAKEMVNLAEQGYFAHGQPFDPAWQEMLNHGTMKVNEAETERLESEIEHKQAAQELNEAEQLVKKLQREWKRNIAKSRPYFELKAKVNQQMEDQKKKVCELESMLAKSKSFYAQTLRNLEKISDEIHHQRRRRERRREQRRLRAASKNKAIYHPLMNSSPEEDSGNDMSSGDEYVNSLPAEINSADTIRADRQNVEVPSGIRRDDNNPPKFESSANVRLQNGATPSAKSEDESRGGGGGGGVVTAAANTASNKNTLSPERVAMIPSPDLDADQIRTNAAVMAAVFRSKQQRVVSSPFLRPNVVSREDFGMDGSETDSVSGSFVSGSVCNLDDEQIESLMRDTDEYRQIVATMDATESDQFSRLPLPARLRHLRDYFNFEPTWEDDDSVLETVYGGQDFEGAAAWENCSAPYVVERTGNTVIESACDLASAIGSQAVIQTVPENSPVDVQSSVWHPLADCAKVNNSG